MPKGSPRRRRGPQATARGSARGLRTRQPGPGRWPLVVEGGRRFGVRPWGGRMWPCPMLRAGRRRRWRQRRAGSSVASVRVSRGRAEVAGWSPLPWRRNHPRSQNGPVSPASRRNLCFAAPEDGRQSSLNLPPYQWWLNPPSTSTGTVAPRSSPCSIAHSLASPSDRKATMLRQVKPMSSQNSRAGTGRRTTEPSGPTRPSTTVRSKRTPECGHTVGVRPSVPRMRGIAIASQAQLAQ